MPDSMKSQGGGGSRSDGGSRADDTSARKASRGWEAPRWLRTAFLGVAGLAVVVVLVLAFRPQPVAVDLVRVDRGTVEVAVGEDGRTRVRDRYVVTAPVAAPMRRITLEAGDAVEAGDEVARLDGPEATLTDARTRAQIRARISAAEAGVERARALAEGSEAAAVEAREGLRLQQVLLAGGSGSPSAVERAEALVRAREAEIRSARYAVEAARGEVEDLRLALEGPGAAAPGNGSALVLRAPVRGTVLRVHRESGGAVAPGEALLEVGDSGALEAVIDLLSADAVRIAPGAEATLGGWGGESLLSARVRRVEPAGFTRVSALGIEEQRVNVILEPTDTGGWPGLGDGFRVEARILVDRAEDVLRVPAGALFRLGGEWAVFVAEGGRLRERVVEVGRRSQAEAEILSGLVEGDRVVIYPSDRVDEGVRYRAR
ncbi:HlyD family efflux transporter periplasmic adaptor subunit [soil metagenome]